MAVVYQQRKGKILMQVTKEFDDFYKKLSSTKQEEIIEHIINKYTNMPSMEGFNAGKLVRLTEVFNAGKLVKIEKGVNAGSTAQFGSATSNKCPLCGRS